MPPHLARNRYYAQEMPIPSTAYLTAQGGGAEEYVFSSETMERPLDIPLIKTVSPLDFFYVREGSDKAVRAVSVLFDNTANKNFSAKLSFQREQVSEGTPLLAIQDGLLYSGKKLWFQLRNPLKEIHRSMKEDGLKLNLFHAPGYDLLTEREGKSEAAGDLSAVGDFEGVYTGGVCEGWLIAGGTPSQESRTLQGVNRVNSGTSSQHIHIPAGASAVVVLRTPLAVNVGEWYDFRLQLHATTQVDVSLFDSEGQYVGDGGIQSTLLAQNMQYDYRVGVNQWATVNSVVKVTQAKDAMSGQLISSGGMPYAQLRPSLRITAGDQPVDVYLDTAKVRRVVMTPFDVEVTGFGVPVNGVGEKGQTVLPLFSDVLEPEDIARRLLGRVKGVLGDADDADNPAWAIAVGAAYGIFPQYIWTAFKEYRLDPALCPHRELKTLAAAMGEPLFGEMLPAEQREYLKELTELIHLKGSSACLMKLLTILGYSAARISKLVNVGQEYRWHYVIFLNAQVTRTRLLLIKRLVNHWSSAWLSYEVIEGMEPWRLDRSQLDYETMLASPGESG